MGFSRGIELARAQIKITADKRAYDEAVKKLRTQTDKTVKRLQASWTKVSKSIKDNARQIRRLGVAVTAAGALITGALGKMVQSATRLGDELDKMSLRTGESVETLSALSFAAQISGSSIQEMENGIRRLSRNMNDFNSGIGEAKRAFDKLGISVTDNNGNLRSASSFIIEVADNFNRLTSSSEQAAVAQEIFGRGGTAMLPLLKQGSAGIKELMDRAEELGLILSTDAARAAALFNDRLTEMKESLKITVAQLGLSLIPVLQPLVERLTEIIGKVANWTKANPELTRTILKWSAAIGATLAVIGPLVVLLPSLVAGITLILSALGPVTLGFIALAVAVNAAMLAFGRFNRPALEKQLDAIRKSSKGANVVIAEMRRRLIKLKEEGGDPAAATIKSLRLESWTLNRILKKTGTTMTELIAPTQNAMAVMNELKDTVNANGLAARKLDDEIQGVKSSVKDLGDEAATTTDALVKNAESMFFLKGAKAPRERLPIVREQLVPTPTEIKRQLDPTLAIFRDLWLNVLAKINQERLRLDSETFRKEMDFAARAGDLAERDQIRITENAIEGKQDEIDSKMALDAAYADWLDKIQQANLKKWRMLAEKTVKEFKKRQAEAAMEMTRQAKETAQTISREFSNVFSQLISGQIESWSDFWNLVKDIAIRRLTEIVESRVFQIVENLLLRSQAGGGTTFTLPDGTAISAGGGGTVGAGGGSSGMATGGVIAAAALGSFLAGFGIEKAFGDNPLLAGILSAPFGLFSNVGRFAAGAFAEGGVATRPTIALVGEKGPEAIIPLRGGRNGFGNTTVNLSLPNAFIENMNEADLERQMRRIGPQIQDMLDDGRLVVNR